MGKREKRADLFYKDKEKGSVGGGDVMGGLCWLQNNTLEGT